MIDPFELLGVKPTDDKDAIQKSFYDLCMLLHPDCGGTKEDMMVLYHAYLHVTKADTSQPVEFPPFIDIFYECVLKQKPFNEAFVEQCVMPEEVDPYSGIVAEYEALQEDPRLSMVEHSMYDLELAFKDAKFDKLTESDTSS